MSSVETISWRDNVSGIEHTSKQLSDQRIVLTCLFGQFFGTEWTARCLQDFEDVLSLKGKSGGKAARICWFKPGLVPARLAVMRLPEYETWKSLMAVGVRVVESFATNILDG